MIDPRAFANAALMYQRLMNPKPPQIPPELPPTGMVVQPKRGVGIPEGNPGILNAAVRAVLAPTPPKAGFGLAQGQPMQPQFQPGYPFNQQGQRMKPPPLPGQYVPTELLRLDAR